MLRAAITNAGVHHQMPKPRLHVRTLLCAIAVALASRASSALAQTVAVTPPDADRDGIPDQWERSGHGPLDPRIHDVRVGRHDFILIAVRRPGLTQAKADASLARVKAFFARVPVRNPDGTTGINMVVVNGPVLSDADRTTDYKEVKVRGIPPEWRGIAHGYLLENVTNVGGQTSASDWSASGHDWHTVVHELGHQFGLQHTPPGSGESPLFPSLMNYTYSYSFNGDPDAIQFSSGEFRSARLNETRLSETLLFPMERVGFLQRELGFAVRPLGPSGVAARITQVDWNRNGIFGETDISADINDGYAVGASSAIVTGAAAGGLSMAVVGARLYLVYPALRTPAREWQQSTPSVSGARLQVQAFSGGATFTPPRDLLKREIVGDPGAAAFGDRLAVSSVIGAVAQPGVPMVALWATNDAGLGAGGDEAGDSSQVVDQAAVASSRTLVGAERSFAFRDRLWLFTWRRTGGAIRAVEVTDTGAAGARPRPALTPNTSHPIRAVSSDNPIGIAFDSLTNRMILVTYGTNWGLPNRMRVNVLRLDPPGRWVYESHRFVGTERSGEWGNTRPVVVLNPSLPIAGHSQITIYMRRGARPDSLTETVALREVADRSQSGGWRRKRMVSQWTLTQSPPAAALFNGVHTFALRSPYRDNTSPNSVVFFPRTGIVSENLLDFNEINWLETQGMVRALEGIRTR
jgi:hypothetical protein